jgi:hypothetical protein
MALYKLGENMSKMSDLDAYIKEATDNDYLAYSELTQEVNSFLHGQLKIDQLSLKAIEVLEQAGLTPLTDGKEVYYNTNAQNTCPNCKGALRLEGEATDAYYCVACNKYWTKA